MSISVEDVGGVNLALKQRHERRQEMELGTNIFFRFLLAAVAVLITAVLLPGVHVDSFFWGLALAAILVLVNAILELITGKLLAHALG